MGLQTNDTREDVDCENGRHGVLLDSTPDISEACVNVEQVCQSCGRAVMVISYERHYWDELKARHGVRRVRQAAIAGTTH